MKPTKSLYLDCLPEDQPEGTYRRARNIVQENNAKRNEPGMDLICDLGFITLHQQAVDGGSYILFGVNSLASSSGSQIGILDQNGNYSCRLKTDLLNFIPGSTFKVVYFRNFKGELIIGFTDNYNTPKIINLDNLPFEVDANKSLLNPSMFALAEMFGKFRCPEVRFTKYSDAGGQLLSGAYYFCFAYEFPDGGITAKTNLTGPVMITDGTTSRGSDFYDGCQAGTITSKAICLNLSSLDVRYKYLRIYVLSKIGGIVSARYIGRKPITSSGDMEISYTGNEVSQSITTEEILVPSISYTKVKTMTILNSQLHLANLQEADAINYQKYANNIKIGWVKDKVSLSEVRGSYKDEVFIFNKRGFFPDEVMAFFIRLQLSDGTSSAAFHIPGREPGQIMFEGVMLEENSSISDLIASHPSLSFLSHDAKINPGIKFFHTRETARENGITGFWENANERYPETEDWDIHSEQGFTGKSLKGQKVRHHKMPSTQLLISSTLAEPTENTSTGIFYVYANMNYNGDLGGLSFDLKPTDIQTDSNLNAYGSWDAGRYTAKVKHALSIKGLMTMSINASSTSLFTNVYATAAMSIRHSNGQVIFEDDYSEDTQVSGGSNVSVFLNQNADFTIELLAGEYIIFAANAFSSGATDSAFYIGIELSLRAAASTQELQVGTLMPIIGISVKDIYIPDQLKDKVVGYEILYAKRNMNNLRVLGQGACFHYQSSHALYAKEMGPTIGPVAVPSIEGHPVIDDSKLRFHSFDLLKDRVSASPSYIKEQFRLKTTCTVNKAASASALTPREDTSLQMHLMADFITKKAMLEHYPQEDILRRVNSFKYIPGDTILSDDGITLNNTWGEGHIFANIEHDKQPRLDQQTCKYEWGTGKGVMNPGVASSFDVDILIGALYQHKEDVYSSMFSQELASTGKLFQTSGEKTYHIQALFGGDTYVNRYATRLTAPIYLSPTVKSTDKYQAVKAIYYFPLYSVHNIDLRHSGVELKDQYYPKVGTQYFQYRDWLKREVDIVNDNTLLYNDDYTQVNDLTRTFPYEDNSRYTNRFPYRIIRSNVYSSESKKFSMREFLALNYYEMPNTRGEITNIEAFADVLYINTRASLFRTLGQETIQTSSGTVALGSGDIFRLAPKELLTSENGYAGCQHMSSCYVTKLGYLFCDAEQGKVFLVGASLEEISNKGLRNYFIERLKPLGSNLPDQFLSAFDEDLNRLILKLPTGDTLSYSPEANGWISMHDYSPDSMASSRKDLVSIKATKAYRHNAKDKPGVFYQGVIFPSQIDICFNPASNETLLFSSFNWKSKSSDLNGASLNKDTFTSAMVYDSSRCSGNVPLLWMHNIRNAEGEFRFNNFRDMIKDQNIPFMDKSGNVINWNIDQNKKWISQGRFIGSHVILRLVYDNVSKNTIYLYSADVIYRLSAR